jgi:hypothetical protein
MVAVPGATPVTIPEEVMLAVVVGLLLHVPPAVVLDKAVVAPSQILSVPVMVAGIGFTVIVFVTIQPVGSV